MLLVRILVMVSGFDGTFGYFDDRSASYLRKLIIERSIRSGGLLNILIFLWREW